MRMRQSRSLRRLVPPGLIPPGLIPVSLILIGLPMLSACSQSTARTFGLVRSAPDAFQVATQPPLSMPPDLTLPQPQPGAPRPQAVSPRRQAEEVLVPGAALSGGGLNSGANSAGQQALVQQAGPPAPANIRQEVNHQAALDQPSNSFVDQLMFWRSQPKPPAVVNAQQETQRLQQDAALGVSPTTGTTPIVKPADRGPLGGFLHSLGLY